MTKFFEHDDVDASAAGGTPTSGSVGTGQAGAGGSPESFAMIGTRTNSDGVGEDYEPFEGALGEEEAASTGSGVGSQYTEVADGDVVDDDEVILTENHCLVLCVDGRKRDGTIKVSGQKAGRCPRGHTKFDSKGSVKA